MFRLKRKPFVKITRKGFHVRGSELDVVDMMLACARALEGNGFDVDGVKDAILRIRRKAGE